MGHHRFIFFLATDFANEKLISAKFLRCDKHSSEINGRVNYSLSIVGLCLSPGAKHSHTIIADDLGVPRNTSPRGRVEGGGIFILSTGKLSLPRKKKCLFL